MRKQLLLIALVWLFANVCQAQKKYEMVIEKTDDTNIVINTEDILRTYFRERTDGDTPQPAAIDIVGTWYVYEDGKTGLDGIWTFNADGTGTIEEFYQGESEGVDRMRYSLSGTRLTFYFEGEEDDPSVFDINVVSENEFTWTDGEDTLTFKRQGSGEENPPSDISDFNIVGKWHQYADNRQEASAEWMFNADGTGYCTPLPIYPGEGPDPFTYMLDNTTLTINWEDGTSVYEIHIVSSTEYWYEDKSDWAKKLTFKKVDDGDNQPQSYLTCPDNHHPHMIDLGLPSGTKWACCNVGATTPEVYGGYYAFGELDEKTIYNKDTYMFKQINDYILSGDNLAGTQYDVAHVKWGGTWVTPTIGQINELFKTCKNEWTTINGIRGRLFTGSNGGSIFMPATGYRGDGGLWGAGNYGYYWSSEQSFEYPYVVYRLDFDSNSIKCTYEGGRRYDGLSVRPVATETIPAILPLQLSSSSISITAGVQRTIYITSGNGIYTVKSNNVAVAMAATSNNTIAISGVSAGTATITVTDTQSNQTASISVSVLDENQPQSNLTCPDDHHPHLIDLDLPSGTKWACCNVDTDHPENQSPTNYGGYYAWGETDEKSYYDRSTYNYFGIRSDIAGTKYDVAHVKWGGDWVMPSLEQYWELLKNCTHEWTTVNGVNGRIFEGKNGRTLFLPAAGYRIRDGIKNASTHGIYWLSQPSLELIVYYLFFHSDGAELTNDKDRDYGRSVRPVSK